jgi:hypothetical protein
MLVTYNCSFDLETGPSCSGRRLLCSMLASMHCVLHTVSSIVQYPMTHDCINSIIELTTQDESAHVLTVQSPLVWLGLGTDASEGAST